MKEIAIIVIDLISLSIVFVCGIALGKKVGYNEEHVNGFDKGSPTHQMYLEAIDKYKRAADEYDEARDRYNAKLDTLIAQYEKEYYKDRDNKNDTE